jgi:tetratricopeptide (TPR) repeat protein
MSDGSETGSSVGQFTLGRKLGAGGFGTVYAAQAADGHEVAVKLSHPSTRPVSTREMLRRQNEIEALIRVNHPSLVKVLGYGFNEDARFYLAMELVDGVGLEQYLAERGRLDVIEALQIVRKVAEAVAACHAAGLLHLDLKPENIVLTEPHEPRLKVLDFGLAQLTSTLAGMTTKGRSGTLAYMAPECFTAQGAERPDARRDLYAIGAILYELLTGQITCDAPGLAELVHLKLNVDPTPIRELIPSVPEPVADLVASLLTRDPAHRLASAAILATRLKELYFATLSGSSTAGEPSSGPAPLPASDEVPFVGRERELEAISVEQAATTVGPGRVLLVVGEAGLGKSRLVWEAMRRLQGALTIYGRCRQLGELVPYSPLREALGQLAEVIARAPRGEDLQDTLAAEALVLGSLVPEFSDLAPSEDRAARAADLAAFRLAGADRVAQAICNVLSRLQVPVVLVLEDIHWADEGTLAVLARMVLSKLPPRLLLLSTSRTGDHLPADPSVRVMKLAPLGPADNDQLLRALLGDGGDLPPSLKDWVPFLSAGNPLFNTQVLRDLELEGFIRRGADGTLEIDRRGLESYEPPDSVATVLERALRRLPAPSLSILAGAALMGRQFSITDLHALEASRAEVDESLREAARLGLCRLTGDVCTFVHDTIREQLESGLSAARLPDLHRQIARQLQRRGAPAGTLGRHLEQAGEPQAAADAFFNAGLEAERLHDPRGAHRHFERAVRLLALLAPGAERNGLLARTVYELVRVGCALGDTTETLAHLDQCAAMLGDQSPQQTAALASSYARLAYVQGRLPDSIQYSAQCLTAVKGDATLRGYECFPANVVGRARCISGHFREAVTLLTRGCDLAREVGEYNELSHSAGLLGVAHAFTGDFAAGRRHADVALDYARRLGDPLRIMGALVYRAAVSEARFDWDQGVKDTAEVLAFAEENALGGLYLYVGATMAGRHQFHIGNLRRSRVLLGNAFKLSMLLKMASLRSWVHTFLADVHFVLGQSEDAQSHYSRGIEAARATKGDEFAEPLCLVGLAQLTAQTGTARSREVINQIEEALARLEAAGNVATRIPVLQRAAETLETIGETTMAQARAQERQALMAQLGLTHCDFWPRIPSSEMMTASPARMPTTRSYWLLQTDVTSPGAHGAGGRSLLDSMATIEGFIPPFQQ